MSRLRRPILRIFLLRNQLALGFELRVGKLDHRWFLSLNVQVVVVSVHLWVRRDKRAGS